MSSDLSNLLKGDSVIWSLGAGLFQPLFNAGRIRGNYDTAHCPFRSGAGGVPADGDQRVS